MKRFLPLSILSCITTLILWCIAAAPGQAHWSDLAVAELLVNPQSVQMTLTYPTGLTAFADGDRSGQLSPDEIRIHAVALQEFLGKAISITDTHRQAGTLTVQPIDQTTLPPTVQAAPTTHTTLQLNFDWGKPVQGLTVHYNLFLPGVTTASCLATILQGGQLRTFVFTPDRQTLALMPGLPGFATGGVLLAIAGAFVWGAAHSLSPGHGKTMIGAYLIGERATPRHALLLALTTTITHTIGVFALGLITLFAARYILPEQLTPWLSLASGVLVAAIGVNLLYSRFRKKSSKSHHIHSDHTHSDHIHSNHIHSDHTHSDPIHSNHIHSNHIHSNHIHSNHSHRHHFHSHDSVDHPEDASGNYHTLLHENQGHHHDDNHHHSHDHLHPHAHGRHHHSHLPAELDGTPVTWRSLVALGVSGGLIPCPAALVLLLGAIALHQVALGIALVLAFSLGLAGVLTGLGLLMVYSRHLFQRVPGQFRLMKVLPVFSAICITLIGAGITVNGLMQVIGVTLVTAKVAI